VCGGHHDALASSQAIVLDHNGYGMLEDIVRGSSMFVHSESTVWGCRDTQALHQILGEPFRAFQLRCSLRWPKHIHVMLPEHIGQAIAQWLLGANDHQRDALLLAPTSKVRVIIKTQGNTLCFPGDTGISGGYPQLLARWRMQQSNGKCVLTTS
jgi:hypothetical protein